jgi:hypothetical protein
MTASNSPSVESDTISRMLNSEERRFNEWLARLVENGIGDKTAATELVAVVNRHAALKMLQINL